MLTHEQGLRRKELRICNRRDQCTIDCFTSPWVFRDPNYLAQALPDGKILPPSPQGGILGGCSQAPLGPNSGPGWLG